MYVLWERLTQTIFCIQHVIESLHSSYRCVTRLTRRVSLLQRELLTIPVCSGVRVTQSLVLCVCLVDRCLSFCTFSFGHCVVCSSSIYGFWLPPFGIFKLILQQCNIVFVLCSSHNGSCTWQLTLFLPVLYCDGLFPSKNGMRMSRPLTVNINLITYL
jgi:hypothetical protein